MPRDLADVLHYLIPGSDSSPETPPERLAEPHAPAQAPTARQARTRTPTPRRQEGGSGLPTRRAEPAVLPIVGIPIGDRDVVRAAFGWNLAVEVARLGARAAVVAPIADRASALWPEESIRPMGADVVLVPATNLEELYRCACEIAADGNAASSALEGGAVFVRIPPLWLRGLQSGRGGNGAELLRWTLLFTSSEERDLLESYGIVKLVTRLTPGARVLVTIHGASHQGEAEAAFSKLEEVVRRRLAGHVTSCGLLVDDLHVYRAIVAQRPIGMVHPQSPAARSMREVAELVLAEAQAGSEPPRTAEEHG